MKTLTPMMQQWHELKETAQDSLLLFRLGDFYEGFAEDAQVLSKELDLTLTKRGDTLMAGMPYHSADSYIDTLISKGYKVAIAEQTEDARFVKGLVKREIVRVITPATHIGASDTSKTAFFASIHETGHIWALSIIDVSTSEFKTAEFDSFADLEREIACLKPTEILTTHSIFEKQFKTFEQLKLDFSPLVTKVEEWRFDHSLTLPTLTAHFSVHSMDGFGLKGMTASINASGALIAYLKDELNLTLTGILALTPYSTKDFLLVDRITERNLELTESIHDQSKKCTLLELLDHTYTPMGGRLLKGWIKQPLINLNKIQARQNGIESLMKESSKRERMASLLKLIRDMERLTMKISSNLAGPRDLVALKHSLRPLPDIKELTLSLSSSMMKVLSDSITPLNELVDLIEKAIVEEPPFRLSDGHIFKPGYSEELDQFRTMSHDSKTWMANYQAKLKEETGIKTLKVGFTKISGFYIEVSRGQVEKVPEIFQRRQTLTNAERYITADLKDYEEKVLTAEDKALRLETELFQTLRDEIKPYYDRILSTAQAIAHVDALLSLTEVASKHNYTKPVLDESDTLTIQSGRHPIIEAKGAEVFIPNNTDLDHDKRMMLITGPNMAGKSTYIRQVALIVIMAQMGSYVPAAKVHLGLIDKVFTRIGASDDLTRGQSTFMVEMTETANILNNATPRSLVILDEIGRGTSTYDGISIAWSVAEYLLINDSRRAKTLFATHFWELTKLEEKVPGALNFSIAVHESQGEITFLRKIIRGGTDKSYGIHVAKLAGLPSLVLSRAQEILAHLEENANRDRIFEPAKPKKIKVNNQLSFL